MCEMISNFQYLFNYYILFLVTHISVAAIQIFMLLVPVKVICPRLVPTHMCCYSLLISVVKLQRLFVGITNAYISVAIDPCNATSSNVL